VKPIVIDRIGCIIRWRQESCYVM